jgi:SNF2 family DNA or RNA helicase
MNIMDARIFGVKTWYHFRARYGVLGGFQNKQIIGWRNLDDLQRRVKPYVLRRLTTDSLELPKKYDPVRIEVPLEAKTWRAYREMRDEMVAWLSSDLMVTAPAAGVKVIRLAQMTSGFVGGVEDLPENLAIETEDDLVTTKPNNEGVIEIGTEKHYAFLQWLKERMDRYEWNHKILVWSRFRSEVKRLHFAVGSLYPTIHRGLILGGQHRNDRRDALRLLDPRTSPKGPVVVIGTPASGSMGLNCTAAWTMVYLSNDFNLKTRIQSMARTHRAGQTHDCEYYDFVATGPNGQKTIDHQILKALDSKSNLASWTAAAWRTALMEE